MSQPHLHALRVAALSMAACAITPFADAQQSAVLEAAARTLHVASLQSLAFSGVGRWYQFGQAPAPGQAWPPFDVSRYAADIHYAAPAARVQITRQQALEPPRLRPVAVQQRVDQYVSGNVAWSRAIPVAGTVALTSAAATPQPAALQERRAEIWSTPQGFVKAALAHQATVRYSSEGSEVSFSPDGRHRFVGWLNARGQVERVQTWIDNPVLGDTLVETRFLDYRDFGGLPFPGRIVRTQGGHPVLDITVADVRQNPAVATEVPQEAAAAPAAPSVIVNKLADGVVHLTGGTHHSVAIEQRDHLVLVEAPQNEERSLALLARLKEAYPDKSVRYVVNTHVHFDHSGGLRTWVDAGAVIVTQQANRAFYEQAWAAPRTLNPDRLARSGRPARFETFSGQHVLSDGKRRIEIHEIAGNGHNDAFALVYLPAEKILVEADAYTPAAAGTPPPQQVNPYHVNLYENIQKLQLDVAQIAALHGPRVVGLADLRAAIGAAAP